MLLRLLLLVSSVGSSGADICNGEAVYSPPDSCHSFLFSIQNIHSQLCLTYQNGTLPYGDFIFQRCISISRQLFYWSTDNQGEIQLFNSSIVIDGGSCGVSKTAVLYGNFKDGSQTQIFQFESLGSGYLMSNGCNACVDEVDTSQTQPAYLATSCASKTTQTSAFGQQLRLVPLSCPPGYYYATRELCSLCPPGELFITELHRTDRSRYHPAEFECN